jgi:copper transport protein
MSSRSRDRRFGRLAIVVLCFALSVGASAATRAILHATLLRSTPAANGKLTAAPQSIRLVFSEQVVPELSQITLTGPDGAASPLKVANDPHDVHALVGQIDRVLAGGGYKVAWRVLSADGHPVGGSFVFSLKLAGDSVRPVVVAAAKAVVDSVPAAGAADSAHSRAQATLPNEKPVPVVAALLRGLGLGALMLGVGLIFFGLTSREHRQLAPQSIITRSIVIGALLLVAHMVLWMRHVSPTGELSGPFVGSLFASTIGRVELLRTVLAVLALWAIALARHQRLALGFGIASLVASGAIGHPAAIDPYWAIPAKVLHLLAAAVWLGGLVWLVWLARCDDTACRVEARRVSALALIAVIVIALSGLLETFLFLNGPADLIHTTYGVLVTAKMIGLAILIAFGAYHRFGLLPELGSATGPVSLSRSVKREIALVVVLIVIGGFLAYVPTPPVKQPNVTMGTESQR